MSVTLDCTVACEASPLCTVCGMRKRPHDRSVPLEIENGMCGRDCSGYNQAPGAGHLWPDELTRSREG